MSIWRLAVPENDKSLTRVALTPNLVKFMMKRAPRIILYLIEPVR
jgi:hypothetical protein